MLSFKEAPHGATARMPSVEYLKERYAQRITMLYARNDPQDFAPEWQKSNVDGIDHFVMWFGAQVQAKPAMTRRQTWCLLRTDDTKPYGPDNCEVVSRQELHERKPNLHVTAALRSAVKEFVQDNPTLNDLEIAKKFRPYSYSCIRTLLIKLRQK